MTEATTRALLAVTSNTSLVVSLSLSGEGWDVDAVPDVESLPPRSHAGVVLVDLGTSEAGIDAAEAVVEQRSGTRVVVIGDTEAEAPTGVSLLLRPFTLDELAAELQGGGQSGPASGPSPEDDQRKSRRFSWGRSRADDERVEARAPEVEVRAEPELEPQPEADAFRESGDDGPDAEDLPESPSVDEMPAQPTADAATEEPEPGSPDEDAESPPESILEQLDGLVDESLEPEDHEDHEDHDDYDAHEEDYEQDERFEEFEEKAREDRRLVDEDVETAAGADTLEEHEETLAEPARDVTPGGGSERDRGQEAQRDEGRRSHRATSAEQPAAPPQPAAPSADEIVERMRAPAPGEEQQDGRRGGLFKFRRRKEKAPHTEKALVRRIARSLPAVQEVLYLLQDAPEIADDIAIVEALLAEVNAQLDPTDAAVWWPDGNATSFTAIASRGLTRAEQNLHVPVTQPLFNELWHGGGGVLIQPTDMAQAAVAGIGGARTDAFMGAAVSIAGNAYAIVTVGADEFSGTDLDALTRIASDAAPGLAIAGLLQKLRAELS